MYVSNDVVMNATLMHLLKPLGPYCSCLKVLCKVEYYLLDLTLVRDLMMSVYVTCDAHVVTHDAVMDATHIC